MQRIKNFILRSLRHLTILWLISLFVFWGCGVPLKPFVIWQKIMHPHTIDLVRDILSFYFPILVTISMWLNVIAVKYLIIFYTWVRDGRIRIGGKAGGD